MYNRSLKYGLIFPVLLMLACGESAVNEKEAAGMQAATDTLAIDPYTLTAEELKDDTVFTDGSRPVSWENAGVSDPLALKKFIRKLQVWVRDNQVDSISGYLVYPMRNPGIKDKSDFKLNYRDYITDGVKAALADQRLNQVFRNEQGAMIGQGQIWFRQKDNNIQIIAINN
ncbi:hypothetical protein [Flavitalea sp.]|nr:hypothetical protein [Flavitalea sp.]